MNHDITHCHGCDTRLKDGWVLFDEDKVCKQRETCHRYLAHLDAKRLGLTYVTCRVGEVDNCKQK